MSPPPELAARKATSCIVQAPPGLTGAVPLKLPALVTTRSSRMLPSGLVITREVKPVPAAVVSVSTVFAPTSRSFALNVVTGPLLLVVLLPLAPTATSIGFTGLMPEYSAIRTSG